MSSWWGYIVCFLFFVFYFLFFYFLVFCFLLAFKIIITHGHDLLFQSRATIGRQPSIQLTTPTAGPWQSPRFPHQSYHAHESSVVTKLAIPSHPTSSHSLAFISACPQPELWLLSFQQRSLPPPSLSKAVLHPHHPFPLEKSDHLTMSHPQTSRNPFMPPPHVTISLTTWSSQNVTFNVLFNIMNQVGPESPLESLDDPSQPHHQPSIVTTGTRRSSTIWLGSDQAWSNFSRAVDDDEPVDSDRFERTPLLTAHDQKDDLDLDQVIDSIGRTIYGFSPALGQLGITSCGMCLEDYRPIDELVVLPCHPTHFFHRNCLRDWFKENLTCPLCRRNFDDSWIWKRRKENESSNRARLNPTPRWLK